MHGCGNRGGGDAGDSSGGPPPHPPSGGPTITISAAPVSVAGGGSSTLAWTTSGASSCTALDGWSGARGTSGTADTGALAVTTTFTLTCSGASGTSSTFVTVTTNVNHALYGLEWDGLGTARRMLLWSNPFPINDATYIFKVFPRKKMVPLFANGYFTTFFWGNNGNFRWSDPSYLFGQNTYYGAHPYPMPPTDRPGQCEISVFAEDYVTGSEVVWNRWSTQAFRA